MLKKIISGGQTGVDRAALDTAIKHNFPCGGFCPKGRKAEDGTISEKYPLTETSSPYYNVRTKKNIEISDATLVICQKEPDGGTALTINLCRNLNKPLFIFNFSDTSATNALLQKWIKENNLEILNIAGPRESKEKGIYQEAKQLLTDVFF